MKNFHLSIDHCAVNKVSVPSDTGEISVLIQYFQQFFDGIQRTFIYSYIGADLMLIAAECHEAGREYFHIFIMESFAMNGDWVHLIRNIAPVKQTFHIF